MLIINTLVGWLVALPHPKNFVVSLPRWSRFRFCTVEALCRDALFHSTPPLLFFVPHARGALWKECSKPGGDAKSPWTARSIPQSPLSSRISPCASPASLLLHRKILFAQNLGIVPTTDSFTHPLPMLHKADSPYFSSARSPERIHLLWHTWTSPVQNRDKMSDTIRQPVCTAPFLTPSSHHGTNCPAFSCHTSCIQ